MFGFKITSPGMCRHLPKNLVKLQVIFTLKLIPYGGSKVNVVAARSPPKLMQFASNLTEQHSVK